jgi:hypothetical protein
MTGAPTVPADWFDLLLERESDTGQGLPASFRAVYGGDWRLPPDGPLPHICVNFCMCATGACRSRNRDISAAATSRASTSATAG